MPAWPLSGMFFPQIFAWFAPWLPTSSVRVSPPLRIYPVYTFVWCPIISLSSHFPLYFFFTVQMATWPYSFIHSLVCSLNHFLLLLECTLYIIYYWVGQKVHSAFPQEAEQNFWPIQYILSARFSKSFGWINQLDLLTPML